MKIDRDGKNYAHPNDVLGPGGHAGRNLLVCNRERFES